jgi:multicomponent Na+:H+ antiporter subunit F
MTLVYELFAFWLVANIALGCLRILRGPSLADRMLAAQLFGTTGVALLLVLAQTQQTPALRDVALVVVLLALLAVAVFARQAAARHRSDADERA